MESGSSATDTGQPLDGLLLQLLVLASADVIHGRAHVAGIVEPIERDLAVSTEIEAMRRILWYSSRSQTRPRLSGPTDADPAPEDRPDSAGPPTHTRCGSALELEPRQRSWTRMGTSMLFSNSVRIG